MENEEKNEIDYSKLSTKDVLKEKKKIEELLVYAKHRHDAAEVVTWAIDMLILGGFTGFVVSSNPILKLASLSTCVLLVASSFTLKKSKFYTHSQMEYSLLQNENLKIQDELKGRKFYEDENEIE